MVTTRDEEPEVIEPMLYFTSDCHLNHDNIIEYAHRPFADIDGMNAAIIDNINKTVGIDDTLWVIGDFCMGREKIQNTSVFLSRISCKDVNLVLGNHDPRGHDDELLAAGFASISDYVEMRIGNKHQNGVLFHYGITSWNGMARGSYMLHGHIHSTPMYNMQNKRDGLRRYDVGVDANGYAPVSADSIIRFFSDMKSFDGGVPDHSVLLA